MNKWVIIGIVTLLVLGVVFGGYYVMQGVEKQKSRTQVTETKTAEIPSDFTLKLFDALEKGLNG